MGARYSQPLDVLETTHLIVEFATRRDEAVDYALVLTADLGGRTETIRVYDGNHGCNEMHRHTKELGKRRATIFHRGTLGEGMRAAIEMIKRGHEEMIDGWRRG